MTAAFFWIGAAAVALIPLAIVESLLKAWGWLS